MTGRKETPMAKYLRSIVVALGAAVLVLVHARPVNAIGPSVIMFYGGSLASPVFVTGADANVFGDLLTPTTITAADTRDRSYVKVAVFWGPLSDPAALRRGPMALTDLKPDMAWQHGKYYPRSGSRPALLLVTALHQKAARSMPDFDDERPFAWGGKLSTAATAIAQSATHVTRPAR
jgi:hypothetical protein